MSQLELFLQNLGKQREETYYSKLLLVYEVKKLYNEPKTTNENKTKFSSRMFQLPEEN